MDLKISLLVFPKHVQASLTMPSFGVTGSLDFNIVY